MLDHSFRMCHIHTKRCVHLGAKSADARPLPPPRPARRGRPEPPTGPGSGGAGEGLLRTACDRLTAAGPCNLGKLLGRRFLGQSPSAKLKGERKMDRDKVIKGLELCSRACRQNCPYRNDFDFDPLECVKRLTADALSMLKAQEPRVMTSEEVQRAEEGTVVWFEQHTPERDYLQPMVSTGDGCVGNNYLGVNLQYVKDGAREYRFWTSRPTEEQRKAVKWDA